MGKSAALEAKENALMEVLYRLLYWARLPQLAAWWNRRRVLILGYHGITRRSDEDPHPMHVTESRFREHIRHLQESYHVISLSDYVDCRKNGRPTPPYSVVLTFDDGYRNFLTVAAPILAAHSMPATVFLITGVSDDKTTIARAGDWTPDDDFRLLSWDEVLTLYTKGIEFGAHTATHPRMDTLPPIMSVEEMTRSLNEIRDRIGIRDVSFAYPYGISTPELQNQAKAAGFTCALTCKAGFVETNTDLFALERTLIGNESFHLFAIHVSGLHRLLTRIPFFIGAFFRSLCRLNKGAALSSSDCSLFRTLTDSEPILKAERTQADPK